LVAGSAESIRGLQGMAGVLSAFTTGTKAGLDFEFAFDGGDDNIGLELRVGLQFGKVCAAIGTGGDGDRDNLIDVLGFGPISGGMVVRSACLFVWLALELIVVLAEGMRRTFLFALVLRALFLEVVTLGAKLLAGEFESSDLFEKHGTLRT
jgi:hypothetical protein